MEGSQETGVGEPVAKVVCSRLVVTATRRRGRGRGEDTDGGLRPQNGVRNFKKFQKVSQSHCMTVVVACAIH